MTGSVGSCRSCRSSALDLFLDLGWTPLADRLVQNPDAEEPTFPLQVGFCPDCALVQILETVSPSLLFEEDYPYYSSFSPALLEHARGNVKELITDRHLGPGSLVIEPASNDGYLLANYVDAGVPVLGIDPAEGPAAAANAKGVRTINAFLTRDLAESLRADGLQADVIHANNVLAHVADTNGFVAALEMLLAENGIIVVEVPYVRELIEHCEFDTIYHEHLCYFSVTSLSHLFGRHGLRILEIRELSIHGGSLRVFLGREGKQGEQVRTMLEAESTDGLLDLGFYQDFQGRVERLREDLVAMLSSLHASGHSIAAYGASAKGSTLLNYTGIGTELLDFVVDRNTHKQGKFMPGKHLPIHGPEHILEERPDFLLLLAWNFAEEIMAQQQVYRELGGRFIVPVPSPAII